MGIVLNNGSSGGRGGRKRMRIISDINITPLVDVMLVLLVVFMAATPMMIAGIDVNLPETQASPLTPSSDAPLSLTVDKAGVIYLMETKVEKGEIVPKLKAITKENMDTVIFIRGDRDSNYGDVVSLLAEVSAAGFSKVSLVTNVAQ